MLSRMLTAWTTAANQITASTTSGAGEDAGRGLVEQIDQRRAEDQRADQLGGGPERELVVDEAEAPGRRGPTRAEHDRGSTPARRTPTVATTVPAAMATPPNSGVGLRCQRSVRGQADHAEPHRPVSSERAEGNRECRGAQGGQNRVQSSHGCRGLRREQGPSRSHRRAQSVSAHHSTVNGHEIR